MASSKAEMLGLTQGTSNRSRERIPYNPAILQAIQQRMQAA